jgi:hypothetical protein
MTKENSKLRTFFDSLSEEMDRLIIEMSEDEYKEYLADHGFNLEEDAEEVLNVFKKADKAYRHGELLNAKNEYKIKKARFEMPNVIPKSYEEKKTLFESILANIPQLSFQHRNIQAMTEDDLESALNQLINMPDIDIDDNDSD